MSTKIYFMLMRRGQVYLISQPGNDRVGILLFLSWND